MEQIDRALAGLDGEPHTRVVASAIARTCWRLGCRTQSPLEWHPKHIEEEQLSDELLGEAWLKMCLRTGMMGVRTARMPGGELADRLWRVRGAEREARGPLLWEADEREGWRDVRPCTYAKKLAGVVVRRDDGGRGVEGVA